MSCQATTQRKDERTLSAEGKDTTLADAPGGEGEEPGLEERLIRLDEIVAALEGDEVNLDEALALFEEGVRHVRAAEKALAEAELRVEELLGEGPDAEVRDLGGSAE